ncbi:hypothetical protein SFRURICE_013573, partial [Spodoptera frugiperda]
MILTRKAHARQEESKLNLALSELKASKELCDQLLKERDDNEREFLDVLNNNKKLKCEMAQLHTQHTEAIEARDRLQFVVDGFSQCSIEYEQTLHSKALLEHQLHEANNQISHLEMINHNITAKLDHLTAKLHTMTNKYSASENQMREYMLAMDELVRSQSQENQCEKCDSSNVLPACTLPPCDTTLSHGASLLLPSQ